MATTWIRPIHKGVSVFSKLKESTGYAKDISKTDGGEHILAYECDARTVDAEFLFLKNMYEKFTGRDQGKRDVIAYHIRQSFPHGEVTPEQALAIGYDLALRWTKGRHQFIVAAHTNTGNPHTHIIFNSTNLECNKKFRNFKWSSIALRRLSDQICLENGLSIIENPAPSKGFNRREYLGEKKPPTVREQLRTIIDAIIPACKSFEDFLRELERSGVAIKRGKQLAFKLPCGKKFSRQDTLGEDYTMEAILERILGKRVVVPEENTTTICESKTKPNLLIDVQAKMQQGYGEGFRQWAALKNIKEMSKTLIYLKEVGLDSYEDLVTAAADASAQHRGTGEELRVIESRLAEISELQKQIKVYGKTRDTYAKYKASGCDENFYETNRADIALHEAARRYFDKCGYGKNNPLPRMSELKQEYAKLSAGKGKLYAARKHARKKMVELQTALSNVNQILGKTTQPSKIHERDAHSL
jgi:hypothetical protein